MGTAEDREAEVGAAPADKYQAWLSPRNASYVFKLN